MYPQLYGLSAAGKCFPMFENTQKEIWINGNLNILCNFYKIALKNLENVLYLDSRVLSDLC